tara:strand:+ start:23 stop:286 length:264 start_codon:yes stop_codon:yes gene_type:complete
MQLPTGKRPRHYADDVIYGRATLDQVPPDWRELILKHVQIACTQLAAQVARGRDRATRAAMLERVPPVILPDVERLAKEYYSNKKPG